MGDSHLSGGLILDAGLTVGGALGLTGNAVVGGTLGVTGATTLTGGVTIGAGTAITIVKVYSETIDPASVAANTVATEDFTVTGLATDDKLIVNAGIDTIGIGNVRASAADTMKVTFINPTAAPIDGASSTWEIIAIRSA